MKLSDIKPGQHFMVATEGMRGHFACEMWINDDNSDINADGVEQGYTFPEPWQSDSMSFANREDAVTRAKKMAEDEQLPYVE